MHWRSQLFFDFGRPLLPAFSAVARRRASRLGLLGFQLDRSITAWTQTATVVGTQQRRW